MHLPFVEKWPVKDNAFIVALKSLYGTTVDKEAKVVYNTVDNYAMPLHYYCHKKIEPCTLY